jgi:hypothetical protein
MMIRSKNWGDPVYEVNRAGGIVNTFNLVTATSSYGMAYDNVCGGGGTPFLWIFDQGSGAGFPQYILQWDLTTGSFTGVSHDVITDFPGSGIAGGLFVTSDYIPGKVTIGGMLQSEDPDPNTMFCYELCDSPDDLHIDIRPTNCTVHSPGDIVDYAVTLTNSSDAPIPVNASIYASNSQDWRITLWGPFNFNLAAGTTIGPVNLSSRIPNQAPPISVYICAEANDVNDCYLVTIE